MKRWVKYAGLAVGSCVVIAGFSAGTLYIQAKNSLPVLEGNVQTGGISAPVKISRDKHGMPSIESATMGDAMFSLGFLHAQERYFQMDLMRRTAAGELAALVGKSGLQSDKQYRIHRFRFRAKQFLAALPSDQRELLRKYVDGVNAGLAKLSSAPFEYSVLFATPAPWTEEDSLLVNSAMYLMLQTQKEAMHPELARAKLMQYYDGEFADFVLPTRSEWDTPMQENEPTVSEALPKLLLKPRPLTAALYDSEVRRLRDASGINRVTEDIVGSNSWAVAGRKGLEGRAVLANDMHLPLQQPNTFYRFSMRLAGRASPIVGLSIPGMPALVAGSNGAIAWGLTNANGDWSDMVRLDKKNGAPGVVKVSESIAVKWGSPETLGVRETQWGPVVHSDAQADYAMNWVAHHPQGNNLAIMGLMQAGSIEEARRIAAASGMPHMNIMFADRQGNVAWTIAGRIPQRSGFAGDVAVEWNEGRRWSGWLDAAEYPVLTSADRDYLWSANNRPVGGEDWKKLGVGAQFALGVRARRIKERLQGGERADEASMHALQLDDTALLMTRWHGLVSTVVAGMPASAEKRQLAAVLAQWTGRASVDSASYRIVRRFRDEVADDLMPALLRDLLSKEADLKWWMVTSSWETPLWRVLSQRPAAMLPAGHANWDGYLRDVLVGKVYKAYSELYNGDIAKSTWSGANIASIRHPLSKSIPLIGSVLDMPSVPMNGDSNTILAQSQSFGPAMRMVVSPGHEQAAILTMPAGQAGNPFSPYYRAGHTEWQQGKTLPLLPGAPRYVLQLTPERLSR